MATMAPTKPPQGGIPAQRPRVSPPHPGEFLKDDLFPDLGPHGMSIAEVAAEIGVSRQHLHDICAGRKPLSVELAVKIAKLAGVEPRTIYGWQGYYDIWHAEEKLGAELKAIKTRPRREDR